MLNENTGELVNVQHQEIGKNSFVVPVVLTILGMIASFGMGNFFNGNKYRKVETVEQKAIVVDQSIRGTNESLLDEIEKQEAEFHGILHHDLEKGQIPLSKEVTILFRMSDLLHLQAKINRMNRDLDIYEFSNNRSLSQEYVNAKQEEMKKSQASILESLEDKTHDGTVDPAWFIKE